MKVCEHFVSIQGEGLTVGTPSLFIRSGRCSVGCRYCDTKYSWNSGKELSLSEIEKIVVSNKVKSVVITGGEPLEEEDLPQVLKKLATLKEIERITVETCGHLFRELPKEKLYLVVSPKPPTMGVKFPKRELLKFLKFYSEIELKFTLYSKEDFKEIKSFLKENREFIPEPIVLQPLEVPTEPYCETAKKVVEMVLKERNFINSFKVRIIPQVHKLLGLK